MEKCLPSYFYYQKRFVVASFEFQELQQTLIGSELSPDDALFYISVDYLTLTTYDNKICVQIAKSCKTSRPLQTNILKGLYFSFPFQKSVLNVSYKFLRQLVARGRETLTPSCFFLLFPQIFSQFNHFLTRVSKEVE